MLPEIQRPDGLETDVLEADGLETDVLEADGLETVATSIRPLAADGE
jgi:hypothetical protein